MEGVVADLCVYGCWVQSCLIVASNHRRRVESQTPRHLLDLSDSRNGEDDLQSGRRRRKTTVLRHVNITSKRDRNSNELRFFPWRLEREEDGGGGCCRQTRRRVR